MRVDEENSLTRIFSFSKFFNMLNERILFEQYVSVKIDISRRSGIDNETCSFFRI